MKTPSKLVAGLIAVLAAIFAAAVLSSCKNPESNAKLEAIGVRLIDLGVTRIEREISGK